jgi:hypothetical protein
VGAVRRAEGVVDVGVGECGQPSRQVGVVLGLARLEADVLEHDHVPVGHVIEIGGELHLGLQELAQALGHRPQRQRLVAALGAAEVRRQHQPGAALAQALDRRQRRADARVVGDRALVQRDVEVDADEDPLAVDVEVVEALHRTFWRTSTQRFE